MANTGTHIGGPIFYIMCGNAAYNRGDRGNLLSQLALIKSRFPDAVLVLASSRAHIDRDWYNAIVLRGTILPNKDQRRWMKKADVIICGGGALLADNSCRLLVPYWFTMIAYAKLVLRKPVMIWANGLVLETSMGKRFAKWALSLADRITVRDKSSLEACQRLGITKPFEQTADPAVLIAPAGREAGEAIVAREGIPTDKPIICLSPTFWHIYHDASCWLPYPMGKDYALSQPRHKSNLDHYKQGIARLAALAARRFGARIVLMPRYASGAWEDVAHCHDIAAMSGLEGNIHILDHDNDPPQQFFAVWKCFALNISVAMHDAIFALVMDTPVLHLHYESKGRDLFEFLGLPELMMPWENLLSAQHEEQILERAAHIMQQWPQQKEQRHAAVQKLQQYARRNADVLDELYQQTKRS